MLDLAILGEELGALVVEQVAKSTAPLLEQIKVLQARIDAFPKPENGKDADPEVIRLQIAEAVAAIPRPQDGKSIDLAALSGEIMAAAAKAVEALPRPRDGVDYDPAALEAAVQRAVAALPKVENGKDADADAIAAAVAAQIAKAQPDMVRTEVERAMAAIPRPQDGKSVDLAELSGSIVEAAARAVAAIPAPKGIDPEAVAAEIRRAVDAIPRPKDGEKPTAADLAPLIDAAVQQAVKSLPAPQNVDPAMIVAEVAKAVAAIEIPKPKDGESVTVDDVRPILEGEVAKWALEFERRAADTLQRSIDRIPAPKDGADGLGFDDLGVDYDGERGFTVRFQRGEQRKEFRFRLPIVIDRGVFKSGSAGHERGDGVTYGGHYWIAQNDTTDAPPSENWRKAVSRGRDAPSRGYARSEE